MGGIVSQESLSISGIARGWWVESAEVWQVSSSLVCGLRCHSLCGCYLRLSMVTNVCIHHDLPFPMQALLVQLPSQHFFFLVPSARQVAISVVPCVLCWSWALAVSPSPPSRLLLLHMLSTCSSEALSLDPSQILSSFLRLSLENHAIMFSSSSFLEPRVWEKQRPYQALLLRFPSFSYTPRKARQLGVFYYSGVGNSPVPHQILIIPEQVFILLLFQQLWSWANTGGNGFVNNVRYTGSHDIRKISQSQREKGCERGATLLGKTACSAWAGLCLCLAISHPDGDNPTECEDIDLEFGNKIVLKI